MDQLLSTKQIETAVNSLVQQAIAKIDITSIVKDTVSSILESRVNRAAFPENSIPFSAIRWGDATISGDRISGGIQTSFGSQGIDDQATDCRLTIMDDFIVVENSLVAHSVNVKNDLVVEGALIIKGDITTNHSGFKKIVDIVVEKARDEVTDSMVSVIAKTASDRIKEDGLDLTKLSINGGVVIDGNSLGRSIVSSNLQKLGQLKELQVRGETLLADTVYVTNKRLGVNTTEPSRSLSVWDEECELVMCKHERHTGYIGSIRSQKVILGSDSQTNILLETDGSTRIFDLHIGGTKIQSASAMPNGTGTQGEIVFNSHPELGKPVGWVCLGGERWACMPALTD